MVWGQRGPPVWDQQGSNLALSLANCVSFCFSFLISFFLSFFLSCFFFLLSFFHFFIFFLHTTWFPRGAPLPSEGTCRASSSLALSLKRVTFLEKGTARTEGFDLACCRVFPPQAGIWVGFPEGVFALGRLSSSGQHPGQDRCRFGTARLMPRLVRGPIAACCTASPCTGPMPSRANRFPPNKMGTAIIKQKEEGSPPKK